MMDEETALSVVVVGWGDVVGLFTVRFCAGVDVEPV